MSLDPSRTARLRNALQSILRKRFAEISKRVFKLLVEEDAFGLKPKKMMSFNSGLLDPQAFNNRFQFESNPQKIESFQDWLKEQIDSVVMTSDMKTLDDAYWTTYVEEAYNKGQGRAFDSVNKKPEINLDFYGGSKAQFLRDSFGSPVQIEKVKVLSSRVFTSLKNVTEEMSKRLTIHLTDGIAQGENPRRIAKKMTDDIKGLTRQRADVIARTEIVRAHAEGQLDALEKLGVDKVSVSVEWSTAGDQRVCPKCRPMGGVVLSIDKAKGLIPRHPNCRCAFIPANVGESKVGQKRSKSSIQRSFDTSLKTEGKKADTLKEKRRKSKWAGADTKPQAAPKSKLDTRTPTGKNLVPNEKKAINYYTSLPGGQSTQKLQRLLSEEVSPKTAMEKNFVRHFKKATSKLPTKKAVGYRGLAVEDVSSFQKGKKIQSQMIESWTTDKTVAEGYSINTKMSSKAAGGSRSNLVVLEYEGTFIDPAKVIANPAGKEIWLNDSLGYVVEDITEEFQKGVGKWHRVKLKKLSLEESTVIKISSKMESLKLRLDKSRKMGFTNFEKELLKEIEDLTKKL